MELALVGLLLVGPEFMVLAQTRPKPNEQPPGQTEGTAKKQQESEEQTNWYLWYSDVRKYLRQNGGFRCSAGIPVRFYKDGTIEALSHQSNCIKSAQKMHYPLPAFTKVPFITLSVRNDRKPLRKEEFLELLQKSLTTQ
jgi:hypothetical protein